MAGIGHFANSEGPLFTGSEPLKARCANGRRCQRPSFSKSVQNDLFVRPPLSDVDPFKALSSQFLIPNCRGSAVPAGVAHAATSVEVGMPRAMPSETWEGAGAGVEMENANAASADNDISMA